jgi:hypothetical protein
LKASTGTCPMRSRLRTFGMSTSSTQHGCTYLSDLGGDIGAAETDRGCWTGTTPFHSTNSTRKSTFRFTRLARSRWTTHSSAIVSRFFLWCLPSAARWTLRFLPTTLTRRSAYSLLFNARIRLALDQSCAVLSIELHRSHIMPCLRPAQTSYGRDEAVNSD